MQGPQRQQRASLARSLPAVYAVAGVRVAFPLVVLPLMASRLGVEEFGRLGLCLVWASLLAVVVEGGFMAAATRQAVVGDLAQRRTLVQRVFSARCVLSLPVALVGLGVGFWLVPGNGPTPADRWETALLIAVLACALGWPATWYLQATSQLHRWAWVELSVQLLLLLSCLLLAHSVVSYMLLQGVAAAALVLLGWGWVSRQLRAAVLPASAPEAAGVAEPAAPARRFALWSGAQVRPGLALGFTMLPVTVIGSAYGLGLPAVAAGQLGRGELGLYYLVDRVVRALVAATDPLVQLVYPRIVERFAVSARAALTYASRWAAGGLAAGLSTGLACWLAWPLLQGVAPGLDTARLRPVFEVLSWLLPLGMAWRFVGYWMLGSGRYDRSFRACVGAGALVGVGGAWWFGHSAVALAGVGLAAEAAVMLTATAGVVLTEWLRRR